MTRDVRRSALGAVLVVMGLVALLASCSSARAATGELAAFGTVNGATTDDQFLASGPVAVDSADDRSLYVVDYNGGSQRLRKFSKNGTQLASVVPTLPDSGYITSIAVDPDLHRIYALAVADDAHGSATAREVLVYSTTPSSSCPTPSTCALVAPSGTPSLTDGVLIDFQDETASGVDFASGLAVDPGTGDVVVLGIDDATAVNPNGVLQYVAADGTPSTRVTGLGSGLDPDGSAVFNPAGIAIGPNGDVFVMTAVADPISAGPYSRPFTSASVYRLPRGTGDSTLVLTDTNSPIAQPGWYDTGGGHYGTGSPIAVSRDGSTVYVLEGDFATARVRGFSTTTGALKIVYGGGDTTCQMQLESMGLAVAAGDGNDVAFTIGDYTGGAPNVPIVHLFGDGGSGCPRAQGLFTVNGSGSGTVTVTKGQNVSLDASASQLLGGTPTEVDWDFDGSGHFETHITGTPPAAASLTTVHKFLTPGNVQVGVRIQVDGAPPTDPVFHQVTVVAPTPTASFKASTRNPAAGAAVTFDAGDSVDSAGSDTGGPSNNLAKYRWDFGDGGQVQETTAKTISHAFANSGTAALARTVKLTVVSHDDVTSSPVQQTITVGPTPSDGGGGGNGGGGGAAGGGGAGAGGGGAGAGGGVIPVIVVPTPKISGQNVDKNGTLSLTVGCPAGGVACTGKIELTVKVKKKVKGKTKVTTVKLGALSFTVEAGASKELKLKLSSAGRSLLKKQKRLNATAAISMIAGGKTITTSKTLTLKASAKKR